MNSTSLEQIVSAVLYEGYILYPYRPSSKKNRRERFTFGRVYPEAYNQQQHGAEPCLMQTECLVDGANESTILKVTVGFLQPVLREIGSLEQPQPAWTGAEPSFHLVPELRVGKETFQTWHEAIERKVELPALNLRSQTPIKGEFPFCFPALNGLEPIFENTKVVGVIRRRACVLQGLVEFESRPVSSGAVQFCVRILNQTPVPEIDLTESDSILMGTFASTHTVLHVENGGFISLMDPPAQHKTAADCCQNIGTWPVLVGDEANRDRHTVLSSPIILYDYPRIAPESHGPLFDGTEIDEILTLRILTMTDQEKIEMRQVDEQARRLLERAETLTTDSLLQLHGTMRQPQASDKNQDTVPTPIDFDDFFGASTKLESVSVQGTYLRAGSRVRICPKARADLLDLAVSGQMAVVEAIEQDAEKKIHLAVVLEADPGKDLGLLRQPGHRFFYGIDEVEPFNGEAA